MDSRLRALGANIRKIREDSGVSQELLANSSGIERSHMGKIERGTMNLTVNTLFKIADTLGVSVVDVLYGV
ncbi:helix-turn-helix domain-containing protein [Agaribacterium sp. ZY112]|uniref:helix-turn-helix domain-containing protein n=1 Tax=Agaribacterium sp. ZY112 TaxID=3233574 RepID=UPI003523BCBB